MPQTIAQTLFPRREGFVKNKKPRVVVLSSPWDKEDCAVRYNGARDVVEALGYRVLNKNKIFFTDVELQIKPFSGKADPAITLWLEAHGTPGWLFGQEKSLESELFSAIELVNFINKMAQDRGIVVENIVLSCCNSATEYVEEGTNNYFNSPARILSFLLPKVNVVGFVGRNSSAKLTNIWEKLEGKFEERIIPLVDGAVRYNNGKVVESGSRQLYCPVAEIPEFIRSHFSFDEKDLYFPHSDSQLALQNSAVKSHPHHYGQAQLDLIEHLKSNLKKSAKISPRFFSEKIDVTSQSPTTNISLSSRDEDETPRGKPV